MILPLMVMAALTMAALAGTLALPETLNQRLPVTLQDAEEFGKFRTISDYFTIFPTEGYNICSLLSRFVFFTRID